MADWYAVQTKAGQEVVAEHHLRNQSYHTHLPLVRAARRRRGQWAARTEPLFPGYLFIELEIGRQDTVPIRSTRGVIGLVRFGERLCRVPSGLVEGLISSQPEIGIPIDIEAVFAPGMRVEIVAGALKGLQAIVAGGSARDRVNVLLELLGKENHVMLSCHDLVPAG